MKFCSVILCEGKIDQIILSYWLTQKYGWEYIPIETLNKKLILNLVHKAKNVKASWYQKKATQDLLCIIYVGGKTNLDYFLDKIEKHNRQIDDENILLVKKTVIIVDKDQDDNQMLEKSVQKTFECQLIENKFVDYNYFNQSLDIDEIMQIALIILPSDENGCLETILLKSLENNTEYFPLIEKIRDFVDNHLKTIFIDKSIDFHNHIQKLSSREKIKLACFISILFPDRTFSLIDKFLLNIEWQESVLLDKYFKLLRHL